MKFRVWNIKAERWEADCYLDSAGLLWRISHSGKREQLTIKEYVFEVAAGIDIDKNTFYVGDKMSNNSGRETVIVMTGQGIKHQMPHTGFKSHVSDEWAERFKLRISGNIHEKS